MALHIINNLSFVKLSRRDVIISDVITLQRLWPRREFAAGGRAGGTIPRIMLYNQEVIPEVGDIFLAYVLGKQLSFD